MWLVTKTVALSNGAIQMQKHPKTESLATHTTISQPLCFNEKRARSLFVARNFLGQQCDMIKFPRFSLREMSI
jgi:hypothetical protein